MQIFIFKKLIWLCLLIIAIISSLLAPALSFAQQEKVDLSLVLLPQYYYREVSRGETITLFMEVKNNGDTVITNIRFRSDSPEGCTIDFNPLSIASLGVGSSRTIDVTITIGRNASRGDHPINMLAEADETSAATTATLRVSSGYSYWLWIGITIGAVVIAGFVFIFFRFGRQ